MSFTPSVSDLHVPVGLAPVDAGVVEVDPEDRVALHLGLPGVQRDTGGVKGFLQRLAGARQDGPIGRRAVEATAQGGVSDQRRVEAGVEQGASA
ncbi:hypothetical protein AB0I77_23335 [Streptomyces sp. NPDC050619]|uniref:hypothetical protein n=1 Tax=Streptomyces sp. NPDC050619 TaxID=3157214 RepID=UPI00342F91AD